jgi:hypothetical protein
MVNEQATYPDHHESSVTLEYVASPMSVLETSSSEKLEVSEKTKGIMDIIMGPIFSGLLGPQSIKLLQKFLVFWGTVVPSRIGKLMLGAPENRPFVLIWDVSSFSFVIYVLYIDGETNNFLEIRYSMLLK